MYSGKIDTSFFSVLVEIIFCLTVRRTYRQWRSKGRGRSAPGGTLGGGILDKLYVLFFLIILNNHYFAISLFANRRLNYLTMLLNAQVQSCGNGPRHLVYALVYSRKYNKDLILLFFMSQLRSLLFFSPSLPYLHRSHSACECNIGTRQCYASDSHNLGTILGASSIYPIFGKGRGATSGGLGAKLPAAGG